MRRLLRPALTLALGQCQRLPPRRYVRRPALQPLLLLLLLLLLQLLLQG